MKGEKESLKKKLEKVSVENEKLSAEIKADKEKYEYMTSLISNENSSKNSNAKDELKADIERKKKYLKEIDSEIKNFNSLKTEFKSKIHKPGLDGLNKKKEELAASSN